MPLPLPNLDDRTYADLVEEARSLLVTYAPDLTNHNPSEPLITLTELFAYFTEILLFRLNVVTDANRSAFLRLLNGRDPVSPERTPPTARDALDAEIRRTVLSVRQTDRAVTPADFEFLARSADSLGRIARTHCIADRDLSRNPASRFDPAPGHVSVVIVPSIANALDELISAVVAYLEPRRLLTTRVHVVGARYVPVSVQVTLHLFPEVRLTVVKQRVRDALTAWFDPLVGHEGAGWPFGRGAYVSEIYRLLDGLDGVDFVTRTPDSNAGTAPLDELRTSSDFANRLIRNPDGELISIALQPDELVEGRIDVEQDIKFVIPTP